MVNNIISVIVPCYNVEKYIERCLKSLLNQDIEVAYEIVVVDDGTKDRSAIIAEEIASKNEGKVRVLHKENGGLSSARNYGIDHSESEYLAFIDSDDYVSNDYLSVLYRQIIASGADISMCGVSRTTNSDYKGKRFDTGFENKIVTRDKVLVIKRSSYSACNKMFRRSLFDGVRFPEGINYEDYATIPRLIMRSSVISYDDICCVYYYVNPTSIIQSMKKKIDWNILKAFKILAESELKDNQEVVEILFIRRVIQSLSRTILRNGSVSEFQPLYEAQSLYVPYIKENRYISELSLYSRVYTRLFLFHCVKSCLIMEKLYSFARKIYTLVQKIL